ncbi:Pentatricopeptide repeat-containing protein [Ananas comosus]|uniref:Pentatricopeptide repeat-containing protein n=1 Tax=Ananas comosus TaxID=4615 RepID=A0A199VXS6_ANACO|nr:Pentatricopeptide repeat-containing protein [Ananas comosus]
MVGLGVEPNKFTFPFVLKACSGMLALEEGVDIHNHARRVGLDSDLFVSTALIDIEAWPQCFHYGSNSPVVDKRSLLDRKRHSWVLHEERFDEKDVWWVPLCWICMRNVSDWIMLAKYLSNDGFIQNGNAEEAFLIFKKMQLSNIEPDDATMVGLSSLRPFGCSTTWEMQHGYVIVRGFTSDNSICNALMTCTRSVEGSTFRERCTINADSDIVTWNTLIAGYGLHGLGHEAISLFIAMESERLKPDDITFISLISACSHSGLLRKESIGLTQ